MGSGKLKKKEIRFHKQLEVGKKGQQSKVKEQGKA